MCHVDTGSVKWFFQSKLKDFALKVKGFALKAKGTYELKAKKEEQVLSPIIVDVLIATCMRTFIA